MTLLQARTTEVLLSVVVLCVASGFANVITANNPSFETLSRAALPIPCGPGCHFSEAPITGFQLILPV